ncbi:MAG: MerR family transcriptional regulator [Cyclobacteriaceae bacterium]|nr:MerR family transcriptional regulator [Cyclobacteriaceae bacterium]MCK5210104.1 MerR family transcriptional regulator [Cyclobacteriaceae bacterium]
MSNYSIKEIEQLSGIKAHTLRMWEQRYNFIKPKRTESNIRSYDDEDLKLVLNISLLKDNGNKISRICNMSAQDLQMEVRRLMDNKMGFPEQIQGLTLAMLELDEDRFEKILSTNILQIGFERTMMNLIYPFFNKIGILWQTGTINPAHEHFMSNLIRQKIIVAIDGQLVNSTNFNKKYLLFLPENEFHEIGLLFSAYIIKSRNNKVIYIGQNVPHLDLVSIYKDHNPDCLLTVMTTFPQLDRVQAYIYKLSDSFPNSQILISGHQVVGQDIEFSKNVVLLNKLQELIDYTEENSTT